MNVLTHALLPTLAAAPFLPRATPKQFYTAAGTVALAGAMADVLNPHLSLAARYASWSHTLYAWAGVSIVALLLAAKRVPGLSARALWLAPLAYASHLALDAISGGIVWLYPFSRQVLSYRLVYYRAWFPIDVALAIIACAGVVWMRQRYWSVGADAEPAQRVSNEATD